VILAAILTLALTPCVSAQAAALSDEGAVEAYRAGEYELALERWGELLGAAEPNTGERGRLLYNAGNAAGRSGSWHRAVAYYTEALREMPRDNDLWTNLEFARREAGMDPADRGDLGSTIRRLLTAWTEPEARWLALGGSLLLVVTLLVEALRGGRSARSGAWFGALCAVISALPLLWHTQADDEAELYVVSEKGVAIRSEPKRGSKVIERAEAGSRRREVDRLSGWVGIETTDGVKGWAPEDALLTLPRPPLESGDE